MIKVLEQTIPFGGGIQLPPNKAISLKAPLSKAAIPSTIIIPLLQHIGASCKPIVNVGDKVLKGAPIAEPQGYISAPVHASTSGTVTSISEHVLPNPSATKAPCIFIEPDGKDTWVDNSSVTENYYDLSPLEVQNRVFAAGVVGLGGAGFPSAVKMIPGLGLELNLLIVNAAECEPYISCDEALIRYRIEDIITGIEILSHALQIEECVIAIEENKTEAIAILREALEKHTNTDIRLVLISSLYPAGGEKQLIKSVTGIEVPVGGLPVDIGVVCYNVGTAYAVKKAVVDAEPLISRIVTITGPGINHPCNLEVLIGTPLHEIIAQCGGYNDSFKYLIMGGPMMGFRLHTDHVPLIKTSNCLLATDSDDHSKNHEALDCIRCDKCAEVCPVRLQPQQLHWHSNAFNLMALEHYHLFDCIECGCCAYVCPSQLPLVDNYRQAKAKIWQHRKEQMNAQQNKQRYLAKQSRDTTVPKDTPNLTTDERQTEIAAAVQRVKAKRERD